MEYIYNFFKFIISSILTSILILVGTYCLMTKEFPPKLNNFVGFLSQLQNSSKVIMNNIANINKKDPLDDPKLEAAYRKKFQDEKKQKRLEKMDAQQRFEAETIDMIDEIEKRNAAMRKAFGRQPSSTTENQGSQQNTNQNNANYEQMQNNEKQLRRDYEILKARVLTLEDQVNTLQRQLAHRK